jgi:hypothetical protein
LRGCRRRQQRAERKQQRRRAEMASQENHPSLFAI